MRTPLSAVFLTGGGRTWGEGVADDDDVSRKADGFGFSVLIAGCLDGMMGREGRGARDRALELVPMLEPGAAPEGTFVGVCRELGAEAAAAAAATGFGGREGCAGRDPTADVLEAPSSCRNFASIRAILA